MERRSPTRQQARIMDAAVSIRTGSTPDENSITYMARPMVQATLPHSDPGNVPLWKRVNGNLALAIKPGLNNKTEISYGYPYGTIPRLLMFWMVKESIKTGSRRLELGNSLAAFMKEIGLNPSTGGGPRSDAVRLRDQAQRLFHATISFDQTVTDGPRTCHRWLNMEVAPEGVVWWDARQPEQLSLFGSWVELSQKFFEAITSAPVPVNTQAIAALKHSSMALDLYALTTFMAYQAARTGEERFISWTQLQQQLGTGYDRLDNLRINVKAALDKIVSVYPDLRLGSCPGGLEILPSSKTAVPMRTFCRIDKVMPLPLQSQSQHLSDMVLQQFRTRYPGLDVYACQAAFDTWLASKKNKPTAYGRAFLGFAKKWAIGKP